MKSSKHNLLTAAAAFPFGIAALAHATADADDTQKHIPEGEFSVKRTAESTSHEKQGISILVGLCFCLLFFTSQKAAAETPKTGFLVVAEDRGFLGNQEIDAVMKQFKQTHPASLALIGKDRQGVEGSYATYIQQALADLEEQDVENIVAIPMFLSRSNSTLDKFRNKIEGAGGTAVTGWAPPMADSYLTAQILLDRVDALSEDPSQEHLIVVANGAEDETAEQRIRTDIENLLHEVTDRHRFRGITVYVYHDHAAQDHEEKNTAIDRQIIRSAARRGRTLLIPLTIGVKFDQHMSERGRLVRKFGEFDISIGEPLMPHPEILTWLRHTANRYSPASKNRVGVLIMPHGSTQPYNDGLEKVISPLRKRYRIEVAPGMGDPLILGQAVRKLEREGMTRIIFVRMYAMQQSMKAKTDYILGLSNRLPAHQHGPLPPRIRSSAVFHAFGGYEEDPLVAEILKERILEISKQPENEAVILLSHGTGDDEANQRWLDITNSNIERIRQDLPRTFKSIKAMTMREDWPEKREQSIAQIRQEIEKGSQNGGRVLIISNRLYGSGPYQRLLEGADFEMNSRGLVPHPNITRWLEKGIERAINQASLPGENPTAVAGNVR